MNYFELTIPVALSETAIREELSAIFINCGFEAIWEKDEGIAGYVSTEIFTPELKSMFDDIARQYNSSCQVELLEEKNWNEEWEKNFPMTEISDKILIRAPFHVNTKPFKHTIIISPKMAFGTGHHSTTQLMLQAMLQENIENKTILDMGCGTGILAIFAAMKKARQIVAIDNDHWSTENTLENMALNAVNNIQVILGDVNAIPSITFDLILANINRNILTNDIPSYSKHLAPKGKLIISGILAGDEDIIVDVALRAKLHKCSTDTLNNWKTITFEKLD